MRASVQQYLNTTYHPDCDYIDGQVLGRNECGRKHGRTQGVVFAWLRAREAHWRITAMVEVRLKIGERRYRIPDVMVVSADAPYEEVVITPPLLCIEILSPCDSLSKIWDRLQDYLRSGYRCAGSSILSRVADGSRHPPAWWKPRTDLAGRRDRHAAIRSPGMKSK